MVFSKNNIVKYMDINGSVEMQMNAKVEKSRDDFYDVVNRKGGTLLEPYINNITKVSIRCGTCMHIWKVIPKSIKKGTWCPLCSGNCSDAARDDFYNVVHNKGGKVVGEYINNSTNVEIQCGTCGNTWNPTPGSIKYGNWCPYCSFNCPLKVRNNFYNTVSTKGGSVIGNYVNNSVKVDILCGTCGNTWNVLPSSIRAGTWCPFCRPNCPIRAKSDFFEEVDRKGGTVVGEYINNTTKVQIQCGECSNIWSTIPSIIKTGHWCPACVGLCPRASMNKFLRVLQEKSGILLTEYNGAVNNVNIQCCKCSNTWTVQPHNVNRGNWCPRCNQSHGEFAITKFLKTYSIQFQPEYKLPGDTHPFDFLIFYNNMYFLVEFDGEQHFEYVSHFHRTEDSFKNRIKVDMFKNEIAYKNGIPLLRISYLELDQVDIWLEYFLTNPRTIIYSNNELYSKTYASIW